MIVKTFVVVLILGVAWIKSVNGASFSKVFMERDVAPVEYYQYGPPSLSSAHLSQINTAPVQFSVPSVSGLVPPCVSPCIIPSQAVAPQSANVLTYNSPISNVPIVVTPTKDEPSGYDYSYVVYDKNTGDHKAQRELSDGSVVRGEYSFLQPDGYVRNVQYVADDVSGFNAIVKNFLPIAVEGKKKIEVVENKESGIPCHDVKNESIKEGSEEESEAVSKEKLGKLKVHHEIKHTQSKKESSEETKEESKENSKSKESGEKSEEPEQSHEHSKEKHEKKESEEESTEEHDKKQKEGSKEESRENSKEKHKNESGEAKNESEEESKEKHGKSHKKVESFEDESEEKHTGKSHKKSKEESKESSEGESKEKHHETSKKASKEESEPKEKSNEEIEEIKEILSHATHANHLAHLHEVAEPEHEAHVSYHDIVHCIQSAISKANETPAAQREEPSPLTYIILNKPC